MTWSTGELWLDADLTWFRDRSAAPAAVLAPPLPFPVPPGLAASRRRREAWKQKRTTRRARTTALMLSPAVILPFALRGHGGGHGAKLVLEDPPSLTLRLGPGTIRTTDAHDRPLAPRPKPATRERARAPAYPKVIWHSAISMGLPYDGHLIDGTQLPIDGPAWVTWDPVTNSVPNQSERLYGNQRTIRAIIEVTEAYRAAHPEAPPVVIGDISRKGGGPMTDEHVSHQNGLDVDVYYPRIDGKLRAPTASDQIDTALAQDLLDRFVAAGAQMIFVGYHAGLRGPAGVVIPYPNHEYHMHVRFPPPDG
jgi:Penicillin-insensitive murein endopeptidase